MTPDPQWHGPRPVSNHNHFEDGGDTTLRVGSLYGARSFLAQPNGDLTGVTYRKAWTPGVNTAECWRVTGWNIPNIGLTPHRPWRTHKDRLTGRTVTAHGTTKPETVREFLGWTWELETGETGLSTAEPTPVYGNNDDPTHDLATCWCGYHSYWRGSLDFASDKTAVNGIVRAFGKVRRGERGFRAQYAEIVALYIPDTVPEEKGYRPAAFESAAQGLRFAGKVQPAELVEAVSARYPAVPIYADLDAMLAFHDLESP